MLYATHAVVDLAAIRHNLAALRERVGGRLVMLPVKADAYGHGAVAVSRMAERTGAADWLAVATVPEALELRVAGITLPILKLSHCLPGELDFVVPADIALAVVDATTIEEAEAAAERAGATVAVHLKVDTGMGRIGARPEDAVALAELVDRCPHLALQGIFTHLPASDMAGEHASTVAELELFRRTVAAVTDARGPVPLVHATPSGATLWHDLTGFDMVRPGIAAYGYYPDASTPRTVELEPAMELRSRITFVKRVRAGETVGYGRTWTAPRDTWVATVPLGYADGYSRANSNRGRMLVDGRSVPVVGRVCMDQTMLDLGPEEPTVGVGTEVVAMGRDGDDRVDADELATLMGTISYEVTCLVSPRVQRLYVDGDESTPGA